MSSTSARPSYKLFMTVLIVENEDNKSAGRLVDASEKHCCLDFKGKKKIVKRGA